MNLSSHPLAISDMTSPPLKILPPSIIFNKYKNYKNKDYLKIFVSDIVRIVSQNSGRIPYEIVKKAVNSGLSAIISKSPPTDKAIELAEKNDILLIGFARNGKFNIYSGRLWEE